MMTTMKLQVDVSGGFFLNWDGSKEKQRCWAVAVVGQCLYSAQAEF